MRECNASLDGNRKLRVFVFNANVDFVGSLEDMIDTEFLVLTEILESQLLPCGNTEIVRVVNGHLDFKRTEFKTKIDENVVNVDINSVVKRNSLFSIENARELERDSLLSSNYGRTWCSACNCRIVDVQVVDLVWRNSAASF